MGLSRLLIANRGEIACRIARSARRLGIDTVAVYAPRDAGAPHVRACDLALPLEAPGHPRPYLVAEALLAAARRAGADAVHPGYGFLSENAAFARAVNEAGLAFVGPSPEAMEAMGDKALARRRMAAAGVPVLPGHDDPAQDDETLAAAAARIGYPVMVKAAAGGGGRGMRRVLAPEELLPALASARAEALSAFGDGRLILERALLAPRHVEVQVFGDHHGRLLHLGERDCSVQRRHQKIVEEAPAPGLSGELRTRLGEAAVRAAATVGYHGAGTVEFLLEGESFFFMEMNTRLQVEHPVTEAITGLDLVEWQLRVARGEPLPWRQEDLRPQGHAIEVRLCAEDPVAGFRPATGRVTRWRTSASVRTDHAVAEGMELSPDYDSMLAKVVAHGPTREAALTRLRTALDETVLFGVPSNRAFLVMVLEDEAFRAGGVSTAFIEERFATPASRRRPPADEDWALAAWLAVRPDQVSAPWLGFASAGPRAVPVRLAWEGERRSGSLQVEGDGSARVTLGERGWRADPGPACAWQRDGTRLHLQTPRGQWTFDDCRFQGAAGAGARAADPRLRAPMNGRVLQVAAAAGARVARGDVLVTLEAMKMEHALTAPMGGSVTAVHVTPGEQVSPGRVLVELAPEPSATEADGPG